MSHIEGLYDGTEEATDTGRIARRDCQSTHRAKSSNDSRSSVSLSSIINMSSNVSSSGVTCSCGENELPNEVISVSDGIMKLPLPRGSLMSQTSGTSPSSVADSSSSSVTSRCGIEGSSEHLNIPHTSSKSHPEQLKTALDDSMETTGKKAIKTKKAVGTETSLPSVFECTPNIICNPLRMIVSQNRRRYQMDGFNLDLTYITDRIIAMGYPADTTEALYRNSMSHIVKFLEHYHPGHYKVFNLRGQFVYDTSRFHNRVISFEMTDHHPPRLELMAPFCREVHDYLQADPRNVVAVHCKAGKGRTGVMICAYLCYISFYNTPQQNMDYYSIIRTHNNKGVTIPSQRRYVYYFSHLRKHRLNYMPLLCELVGVYLERPPKLSGTFSKGSLKVRVSSGDVDVFIGDDLWLDNEKFEQEEEMNREFHQMSGDDQYNPYKPEAGKDCISRRCYGWTVPSDKRVFLQGDVRVDIFQKSLIKLLNVNQERKKVGHIWFNTMFTCPGFSGDQYVHGDDMYDEGTNGKELSIIRRHRRAEANERFSSELSDEQQHQFLSHQKHSPLPQSPLVDSTSETSSSQSVPDRRRSSKTTKFGGFLGARNGDTFRTKRPSKSPVRQTLLDADQKALSRDAICSWQSQDGDLDRLCRNLPPGGKGRSSLDTTTALNIFTNDFGEDFSVEIPPGLEEHCPTDSLKAIFDKQTPPRHVNAELIRDAFRKNLISSGNSSPARRSSICAAANKAVGLTMPHSPIGRPNADGPWCLMRGSQEHVSVFRVNEIDRAHKSRELDSEFKVFVVTRCLNQTDFAEIRLAQQFVQITEQKQANKEQVRRAKLEARQKKIVTRRQKRHVSGSAISSSSQTGHSDQLPSGGASDGFASSSSSTAMEPQTCCHYITDSSASSMGSKIKHPAESTSGSALTFDQQHQLLKSFGDDPRATDPHLRKFFFRQRITSQSRHPNIHYHCPVQPPNITVCSHHSCTAGGYYLGTLSSTHRHTLKPSCCYADDEADLDSSSADSGTGDGAGDVDPDSLFCPQAAVSINSDGESTPIDTSGLETQCYNHDSLLGGAGSWSSLSCHGSFPDRSVTLTSRNIHEFSPGRCTLGVGVSNDLCSASSYSQGLAKRRPRDNSIWQESARNSGYSLSVVVSDTAAEDGLSLYHPPSGSESWAPSESSSSSISNEMFDVCDGFFTEQKTNDISE